MIILYKKLQYINKQLHNIIHSGSIPKQLQQKLNITQNIMKQQISAKPLPYSLLTSMYLAWQEYKVPAVYYHYLLSVLPNMQKKQQMLLMINQVKSLKANNHSYHRIVNAIQARERSLEIIKSNIEVFIQYQSTNAMDWPQKNNSSNHIQLQFDNDAAQPPSPYRVTHEDPRNPILSPSLSQSLSSKSARLQQLLNHIRMYQRMTAQIIIMISQWQNQLKQLGYNDSVVQFQFHKQDYIQRINNDTLDLLDRYQSIFENNCFFIIKKIHQKSQYALIYKELKFSKQMLEKVNSCLNIIANHEADILRFRMLSKVGQAANRRRKIIKSTDISKIYMNYNNGSDYLIVQDTETMKKSKILHQPILNRNKNLIHDAQIQQLNSALAQNAKLKSLKNSIIINPEARLMTIDKTARKHPVQSSLLNLLTSSNSDLKAKAQQVYLKNPQNLQMSPMTRKNNRTQQIKTQIKRSTTLDQSLMKRRNTMDINLQQNIKNTFQFKTNMSQAKFRERVEVKPIHGQNSIFVRDRDNNNREDQLQKNKGLSVQRKLEAVQKINLELKLKNKSYAERKQQQKNNIKNQPAFDDEDILKSQRSIQPQVMVPKQVPGELSQQSDLIFNFQQNIKSTEIVKYLRTKVFNNSPEVGFQQIQALAKKLLADKNYITFIRITSGQLIVAWLAVKFVQKDNTMRRSVHIVYVRKFVRMSGFQRKLLDGFVTNGYGLIRNQERILYQVELLDVVLRPLLKIKYKLSPSCQKAQLKKIMSKNATIAKCRLLKYHSYSKQTKYHRYCQHNKSFCMISYNFLQISRICVNNLKYIQAKADKIIKLGEGLYRVSCIVNQTDLVISNTMMDLIGLEQQSPIQRDSSFEQGMQTKYRYIAVKQNKTMKKYVNQKDQTILCQFITISGNIPEVKSIAFSKEDVKQNVLILEPPYFMAIMTKDVGEAKMLSVIQFS